MRTPTHDRLGVLMHTGNFSIRQANKWMKNMAYTERNYKTKKSLREAIANGVKVRVYQPNSDITGATIPDNGVVYLEGPHYPQPHKWYAVGEMKDGFLVKIK